MNVASFIAEPLFYHAELASAEVVLTGDEARHVAAQRLRAGDAIAVFDGRGCVARGSVQAVGRDRVHVKIEHRYREPAPLPRLELYSAVPKGDRMAVLLDMATQLGMARFTPVRWQRSVTEPGARAQERWSRICIEACKQSRRVHVPDIAAAVPVADAAERACSSCPLLVAHPSHGAVPITRVDLAGAQRIALFVGPEGGLTDQEVELLRERGAAFVGLGDAVLRVETAAVALIALAGAVARSDAGGAATRPGGE